MDEDTPDISDAKGIAALRSTWVASMGTVDQVAAAELDDILTVARQVAGVPAAAVVMVGADSQWFLASQGMELSDLGPEDSFCAHAVRDPHHVLVVTDAQADPHFATTRSVQPPGTLRFYAGSPLVVRDDVAVGTLCVIDDTPHELSGDAQRSLQSLARRTVGILEAGRERAAATFDPVADGHLGHVVRKAPFGIVLTDAMAVITDANDAFIELAGLGLADLVGQRLTQFVASHQRADQRALFQAAVAGGQQSFTTEVTVLAGRERTPTPAIASSTLVRDTHGVPFAVLCRVESIAARRSVEASLRETQSLLDAIITLDAQARVTSWNEGAVRMFGWERFEMLGQPITRLQAPGAGALPLRAVVEPISMEVQHRTGLLLPVEMTLAVWGADGTACYTAVLRDISERIAAEAALVRRALTDPLTGLGTRRAMADTVEPLVVGAGRVALGLLDLDRFTMVNEALGHLTGDRLLLEVGRRLAALLPPDRVFRTDGDEFAVILELEPEDAGLDLAGAAARVDAWAHSMLRAAAGPYVLDGIPVEIEASMGIALAPDHSRDLRILLGRADAALTSAKRHRDAVVHWSIDADGVTAGQLSLLADLREAIGDGQLRLHYQPIAAPPGDRVLHVEALVRWEHPTLGMLPPGMFIPLAEPTRLILPLTRWVMDEALRQRAAWAAEGLAVRVSVNVSPRAFARAGIVRMTQSLLAAHDCDAADLVIEITESALHEDPDVARATLAELRALGVGTALDDFGAGSTSLQLLRRFRVDELKLDMLFVKDVVRSPFDAAVVKASIGLAESLKIRLVVEGVEDQETADFLRDLGASHLQGYHFSRPIPADQIPGWARSRP